MAKLNRLQFDGLSRQSWSEPTLADLTAAHSGMSETSEWDALTSEQKRHIRHHFLVTVGDTDSDGLPENFGQFKLPVVTPNHKLSKKAVDNADARLNQVKGLGNIEADVRARITTLQEDTLGE